jgi:hypothetical protein
VKLLNIRAGPKALAHIKRGGLAPADIALVPAAAGGPKGLALNRLDRYLFADWLPSAPRKRHLIGASIGAWRMAAACMPDPRKALARLADLYCDQRYPWKPSREFVSRYCQNLLDSFVGDAESAVLSHPHHRLVVLAVRGKSLLAKDGPRRAAAGFFAAALANSLSRRALGGLLDRTWFHDARDPAAVLPLTDFTTHEVPLSAANLKGALLASASIPLVLDAVSDIADAPAGSYWDGGIIDYHLHLPYPRADGLVLYPHFVDYIVPGWLDKAMPWRRARGEWLDNVIIVSPSREWIATLPQKKIPDRNDFKRFGPQGQDARVDYWKRVVAESERLGDAFAALVERGEIAALAQPIA